MNNGDSIRKRAEEILNQKKNLRRKEYIASLEDIVKEYNSLQTDKIEEFTFKMFYKSLNEFLCVLDEKNKILDVNEYFCRRLSYTREELIGLDILMLYQENKRNEIGVIINSQQINHSNGCSVPLITKNGDEIAVDTYTYPGVLKGHKVIFGISRDISQLKQTALLLNETQRIAKLGGWEYDIETATFTFTQEFYRILGESGETVFKKENQLLNYIRTQDKDIVLRAVDRAINEQIESDFEVLFSKENNNIRWLRAILKPVIRDKKTVKIIGYIKDISDRKKADIQLKEAKNIFDNIQIGLQIYQLENPEDSRSLKLISANPASEMLTGIPNNTIMNKRIEEVFPFLYKSGITKGFYEAIIKQTAITIGDVVYDDELIHDSVFSFRAFPLPDNHVGISFENVTDRKKNEDALKERNRFIERIASIFPGILTVIDIEKKQIIYFNNKMFEMLGYTYKEFIEMQPGLAKKIMHPEDYKKMPLRLNDFDSKNNKNILESDIRLQTSKGEWRLFHDWTIIFSADPTGKPKQLLSIMLDVTEHRKTVEEINRIFELSADMICIASMDGYFKRINPAFQKTLGYSEVELLNQPFFDLIHPDDLESTKQVIEIKLKNGVAIFHFENRYRCKDGNYRWISWVSQPSVEENLIFAIARDMTDQKNIELELRKAKEKAEESDRLKSAFLANMSHEIRTPLNAIVGFANLLSSEKLVTENKNNYIHIINRSANQLLGIINDIIDISKIEAGLLDMNIRECNINLIIDELLTQFDKERELINKKNLKITVNKYFDDDLAFIQTDEIRLRQVLVNLISNSLKFTKEGFIEFGYLLINNKKLLFYVKDSGIGISSSHLETIFERFIQEDGSFTRKFGGTGLGLAISKGLAQLLGGQIWAESIKDAGSTFFLTIPYIPVMKPEIITKDTDNQIFNLKDWSNKTILIVDDTEDVLHLIKEMLSETKSNLIFATTGKKAIEICEQKTPINLILMDIQLPDINGYETTNSIKNICPEIPVIAQTAYALISDKEKAIKAGCLDYISKPFNKKELINIIDKHIH